MSGLRVVDTFCGAGGFSEGFRQAGFDVVYGVDNWRPARETHEANGLGESSNLDMFELIDEGGYKRAKELAKEIEGKYGKIDVLIGSPPCTEFSFAKKGGSGDLEKGMLLVRAHLVLAAALKPKYWLMENVPRLKNAISEESEGWDKEGFMVPLKKLGIKERIKGVPWINKEFLHVPYGEVYVASEFGAPQRRRRFIAGNVPPELILSERVKERTMHDCLSALESEVEAKKEFIADPNYPHHKVPRERVRGHFYDTSLHPMYWEEMRHLKRRHIHYGRMAFPDDLHRPGRTIMATFNPSSREAVLMDTGKRTMYHGKERPVFRQPTVREVACLQGFPLDYQLVAGSLSARYKLVGNAVPCQLSYALAKSILEAFELEGFEDAEQEARFKGTLNRLDRNRTRGTYRPIITRQEGDSGEASDFHRKSLSIFGSRPDKHIRRKFFASKPKQSSSVVIFENTVWTKDKKRRGGVWKACIQQGMGKRFSQVYLDEVSVKGLLRPIERGTTGSDGVQMTFEEYTSPSKKGRRPTRAIVRDIIEDIDKGIPLVKGEWSEFPGYRDKESKRYLRLVSKERLKLPSSSKLQELFTSDTADNEAVIGPLDLFDGLDAIMLRNIARPGSGWVLDAKVPFKGLKDNGEELYDGRISRYAHGRIDGELPLVTVIAALASVYVLHHMHENDSKQEDRWVSHLNEGWHLLDSWAKESARPMEPCDAPRKGAVSQPSPIWDQEKAIEDSMVRSTVPAK